MNPKTVTVVLLGGVLMLAGGGVLAAMLPPTGPSTASATSLGGTTSYQAAVRGTAVTPEGIGPRSGAAQGGGVVLLAHDRSLTYVVHAGDTVSRVASYFGRFGLRATFTANAETISADDHLLFPGERITIDSGHITVTFGSASTARTGSPAPDAGTQ
jgi:hypothetical protein